MVINCIFCKIIADELPAETIYRDDQVLCFLDIAPINLGHSLVIPIEHHTSITTVPSKILARMMNVAPWIAQAIVREVDGDGFNLHLSNGQCAGQIVPHTHLHIIPRSPTDGFTWGWRSKKYVNEDEKRQLAHNLAKRLRDRSKISIDS